MITFGSSKPIGTSLGVGLLSLRLSVAPRFVNQLTSSCSSCTCTPYTDGANHGPSIISTFSWLARILQAAMQGPRLQQLHSTTHETSHAHFAAACCNKGAHSSTCLVHSEPASRLLLMMLPPHLPALAHVEHTPTAVLPAVPGPQAALPSIPPPAQPVPAAACWPASRVGLR